MNAKGRSYVSGKGMSRELRELICEEMKRQGAPEDAAKFPGLYTTAQKVSDIFHVSRTSVVKYWQQLCIDKHLDVKPRSGRPAKLSDDDLAYIEMLKSQRPSITSQEIKHKLEESGSVPHGITEKCINDAVRKRLSTPFTRKKITPVNFRRFTQDNVRYTQSYIDVLYNMDPYRLKFFDETGFQFPDTTTPRYGHAPKGVRCIDINRYAPRPNVTLGLLIGTSGVLHADIVNGAMDGYQYSMFFHDALEATEDGYPVLSGGDTIVVDNCPTHHGQYAQYLYDWLGEQGIGIIFTPKYSPEFNPCENCFGKMKGLSRTQYYRNLLGENLKYGIHKLVDEISSSDVISYYRNTGYLQV